MPSGGGKFESKHDMHLHLIKKMLDDRLWSQLQKVKSLEGVYNKLREYYSIGPFLAFQYAIDLNYSPMINHSEMDFVVAGPGALDGLSKCFDTLGDYSPSDTIKWISERHLNDLSNNLNEIDDNVTLFGRQMQLIDIQNILCEVSKYTRISNPERMGISGRIRIKQIFTSNGELPSPTFPAKCRFRNST